MGQLPPGLAKWKAAQQAKAGKKPVDKLTPGDTQDMKKKAIAQRVGKY